MTNKHTILQVITRLDAMQCILLYISFKSFSTHAR